MRHRGMREHNLALVLATVAAGGPTTRARLAETTGLTKSTVSSLVAGLVEHRLLVQAPAAPDGERGRPGSGIGLHGDHVAALGIEVAVGRTDAVVLDLRRRVRVRLGRLVGNRRPAAEVLHDVGTLAAEAVTLAAGQGLTVVGAALGLPALLDRDARRVLFAPNLGWRDVDLDPLLAELLPGAPFAIRVDNEANVAALGELRTGSGRDRSSFVLVTGEVGIGAGLVLDSALHPGAAGFAGEIGHLPVRGDGRRCACGARGCLETVAGREAVLRAAGRDGPGGFDDLLDDLRRREPAALSAVAGAGDALATALGAVVKIVDPGTVILGGPLAALGEPLATRVAAGLRRELAGLGRPVPDVLLSGLAADAALVGAALSVLDEVLADPARAMTGGATPPG
ncbi:ROK family transcriptional regulator [Pseudonocardia sp. HH130630-07]|uniref:ROK family transcriptional regulator n=1 Tax=Pseudonocardia sp. HH130630-07 TaxID=1690815 RepID=UPI00081513F5|nr:ROK family transcriptional regulator [Pseudonocardia sp. HH130630-07]ANY06170.1 hypothetical protein AFB00_07505 [Pseudonocardia sp. HH130630-07]